MRGDAKEAVRLISLANFVLGTKNTTAGEINDPVKQNWAPCRTGHEAKKSNLFSAACQGIPSRPLRIQEDPSEIHAPRVMQYIFQGRESLQDWWAPLFYPPACGVWGKIHDCHPIEIFSGRQVAFWRVFWPSHQLWIRWSRLASLLLNPEVVLGYGESWKTLYRRDILYSTLVNYKPTEAHLIYGPSHLIDFCNADTHMGERWVFVFS